MLDAGCDHFMLPHLPCDVVKTPHGRAGAVAAGYKRVAPDELVVAIQGDGGFMGIGAGESLHLANRGEAITLIVLNNAVLADTGGQLGPGTPLGERTTTTVGGRRPEHGGPLRLLEYLATFPGVAYANRLAIDSPSAANRIKKAFDEAFTVQRDALGLSVVELLSPCPTHWLKSPIEAWRHVREDLTPLYPTGSLVRSSERDG
jgi:2-oxoglutarate ferredoxin oxidoreductase subunit beta